MDSDNTRKTNKNKNIKHKSQTTNITQKTAELQGKQLFFHRLKAKQETRDKPEHKTKTKKTKTKPT